MKQAYQGFTPAGLVLAIAVFIFLGASLFAFLSNAWHNARDQKQIEGDGDARSYGAALGLPDDPR